MEKRAKGDVIQDLPYDEAVSEYKRLVRESELSGEYVAIRVVRELALHDLFFLLVYVLGVDVANNEWVYNRCRDIERETNNYIDLWPREHFKSTIITIAHKIQLILNDPNITICIMSFTRSIAKGFLREIKNHFEMNERLKQLFPDILWADPRSESPRWNDDTGLIVKRTKIRKEATIEAWGVIDGQPTSKHYDYIEYDDVITADLVRTPDMRRKVMETIALSFNLGSRNFKKHFSGTRYHYDDGYSGLLQRGFTARVYAATKDGKIGGEPWLWPRELLDEKMQQMGPAVAAAQLFNNPIPDEEQVFKEEYVEERYTDIEPLLDVTNRYIFVDAANEKKASSDYTVMMVIGAGQNNKIYVLDMIRDRLDLNERTLGLFDLVRRYRPLCVYYERYGLMCDIQHIKLEQNRTGFHFSVKEVGGKMSKNDRIKTLQPYFYRNDIMLPQRLVRTDSKGKVRDYIDEFIKEEYLQFPFCKHDDMLDCLARVTSVRLDYYNGVYKNPLLEDDDEIFDKKRNDVYSYNPKEYLYSGGTI